MLRFRSDQVFREKTMQACDHSAVKPKKYSFKTRFSDLNTLLSPINCFLLIFFFSRQKVQVSMWTGSKEGWEGKTLLEQSWRVYFSWISCIWHLCWVSPRYNSECFFSAHAVCMGAFYICWYKDFFIWSDTRLQTMWYQLWRATRSSLS